MTDDNSRTNSTKSNKLSETNFLPGDVVKGNLCVETSSGKTSDSYDLLKDISVRNVTSTWGQKGKKYGKESYKNKTKYKERKTGI